MILLTGGAGFIGSNILEALNEKGISDILVVDNLHHGEKHLNLNDRQFIDYLPKERLLAEINNLGSIDLVIHQGACAVTTEKNGAYMMENNYEYAKQLLKFCVRNKVPLIYASSAAVYGNGERGFDDQSDDFYPLNVYAYSKLLFDRMVRGLLKNRENTAPVTGLRYFNVFGPGEHHKGDMASVPYKFFRQWQEGKTISLFEGSEGFYRDFIFVQDVVNIVMHFMQQPISGIFNAGTGMSRSFQDVADAFVKECPGANVRHIPFPSHLIGKYQRFTQADVVRLQSAGYDKPSTTLEDGIKLYMKWLKAAL